MNKTELLAKASRSFNKVGFVLKKHSPEILAGIGTIGIGVGTVMACKATTKASAIKEQMKEDMEAIQYCIENNDKFEADYTEEDVKKDTATIYAKTAMAYVKLYAPAVITTTVSVGLILKGHHILRKRNIALVAAYKAVDKGFKDYRGRVIERFGKELDYELRHNIKAKEIEETTVLEDGTEVTETKTVNVVEPSDISMYAKFFDEACAGWRKDPEANRIFVQQQEKSANEKLKHQGHLYLNEVYDMLGIPRTKAGQIVGWIYDDKATEDDFVSFGLFDDYHDERKRAFVNGYERNVLLDFNVQGPIIDLV